MAKGFYQDELASGTSPRTTAPLGAAPPARPAGVGAAVLQHLLLLVGGPLGALVGVLVAAVAAVAAGDSRPLVKGTSDAILRFVLQLALPLAGGIVLLARGEDAPAVVLLAVAIVPLYTLPLLAAWRTWRTGRVFRYPVWDLLRAPD